MQMGAHHGAQAAGSKTVDIYSYAGFAWDPPCSQCMTASLESMPSAAACAAWPDAVPKRRLTKHIPERVKTP